MPCIGRDLRAYSCKPFGANHKEPSHSVMAARASFSANANGSRPAGLIWRWTPVSVTTGVAQNGHSFAWTSASNSTCAPQLGQFETRVSSISASGSLASIAARKSSSSIGDTCLPVPSTDEVLPQKSQVSVPVDGSKRKSAPQLSHGKRWSARSGAGGGAVSVMGQIMS